MRKLPKIISANKSLKINFYIAIACYILLLLLLEPIISYLLLFDINQSNLVLINALNEKKSFLTYIAYGILRLFPMMILAWFGYRVLSSAQLPPAKMGLPFAVPLQKGRNAKIIGISIMAFALLFMAQNVAYVVKHSNVHG